MSELKGLSAGIRALVRDENFRNGSQPAVEYEPYVVELGLGRRVSLDPLRAILQEGRNRHSTKWSDLDSWLAPRVHATLRLTRREAADRRLWAYLNVGAFPDHVRWRWLDPNEQDRAVPIDRFLGDDSTNQLGRLWWGAELTRNGSDYSRARRAFSSSQFARTWQVLDVMHHRPAALALIDFLDQFNEGKGATDSQGARMARALNAALRTLTLDAVAENPEPDGEAFHEWVREPIDETKMMDELPRGPEEKEPISNAAIAAVREHLEALAQAIGLASYVRKHRRTKRATAGQGDQQWGTIGVSSL
jgi:hypothetical protein